MTNQETHKLLHELLRVRMEAKGLSAEKVSELIDVPKHYLDALLKGDFKKLPAAPYVKGYLQKLAKLLELDSNELWDTYKEEFGIKSSGAQDTLPANRFAIRTKKHMWTGVISAVILIMLYFGMNANRLFGRPTIVINQPARDIILINTPGFTVSGRINPKDKLIVNHEEIYNDPTTGEFQQRYNLQAGINTFEFVVRRFLAKETKVVRQVIYQPQ